MSLSTLGSQSSRSTSSCRRTSDLSFSRGSISARGRPAGQELRVVRIALLVHGGAWRALLVSEGERERTHGHLELCVVGLDGRDLLHQKAGPQQEPQRSALAIAREQALQLERDRR